MSKWDKTLAAMENNMSFMTWYTFLSDLIMSRYKWENLPDSMNERFLEMCLYQDGKAVLVNDDIYSFLNLRMASADTLNIYELPTRVSAYSLNYHKTYNLSDVSIVQNNYSMFPDMPIVINYSKRLYECTRTSDINLKAQKTPVLVTAENQNQRLTLKNLYMKYDGNEPVIYAYKDGLEMDTIRVLKTDAPFLGIQIHDLQNDILNEFLTRYGLNNANTDKRERLNSDEVNANNQLIELASDVGLLCRKQAVEKFNKMYGTSIKVSRRVEMECPTDIITGGEEDE